VSATEFNLTTNWTLAAPREAVWRELTKPEDWPVEPMTVIEGRAEGELSGVGRWTVDGDRVMTRVRYDWRVEVTQPWMRFVAPLARPVFAWNHGVVMGWGGEGLARRLAALA
jgi:hypothetical protein